MRTRYVLLAAAALAWPLAGQAQEAPAVSAAKAHFLSSSRLASADLADLSVSDSYLDRRSGATMVYLSQRHNGVDIFGTTTAAAVRGERVFASGDAFESDLATRANDATPSLSADGAVAMAEQHARALTPSLAEHSSRGLADDPRIDAVSDVTYRTIGEPTLVYQPMPGGALRLAWAVELGGDGGPTGQQLWSVRVDAQTGTVLAADDLVAYDHFGDLPKRTDFAPTMPASHAASANAMAGSYRVLPFPFESPTHGDFAFVSNPDDADASPFGWHDTNGAAGAETTRTTGANVDAYIDSDNTPGQINVPDAAFPRPDGGSALTFDFAYDEEAQPDSSPDAVVTNLFYWNNITHDLLWQYGFDEPSGNFQVNNYGRGGEQQDAVIAEALDGSGTSNANFSTPNDGVRPRMQMFEWPFRPEFTVTAPADLAGVYNAGASTFGGAGTVNGTIVAALDAEGLRSTGCTVAEVQNTDAIAGNVALIRRGTCAFSQKADVATELGATAVIIFNCTAAQCPTSENTGDALITMIYDRAAGSTADIPALFINAPDGNAIADASSAVTATISKEINRDSDLDSGIIMHEYGHGVSNRLTGGPGTTACLSNGEQMGEGWSDFIGVLASMKPTDTRTTRRGVGTYVGFEPTDGQGIRPAPYTTDFAVNGFTYQDVIDDAGVANSGLTVPHGLGFVWSSMLWDMTWNLVDRYGFGDIYDADGGKGNQIAMQLMVQGLKLQPCSPGFVDGRDAIFAADELLFGGANKNEIGQAFAARGLGLNADQGLSSDPNDGTADFTAFPVASETDAAGRVTELAVSGQNPFRSETSLTLSVGTSQEVTVEMIDLLGRRVATLFAGEMSADSAKRLAVSADGLPSGVYLVRATGETFSLTERITITR